MEEWVTLKVYTHPHDAYAMLSKLEFEGLDCRLKDENTLLAHSFLSAAIGGVKLQVKNTDYDAAVLVLMDAGYEPDVEVPNALLIILDRWSSGFPFINQLDLVPRILGAIVITFGLLVFTILALLYF